MINDQGNYFIQKIIKDSNIIIISCIVKYISDNLIKISNNRFGNYVIQKIIEKIRLFPDVKTLIFNSIKNKEMELIFNEYGSHVLQKILLVISDNNRLDLNKTIISNILDIIMDINGIHIFKCFILTSTIEQNKRLILEKIEKNFSEIVQNPNGTYAIQLLFKIWGKEENLKYIKDDIINDLGNSSFMKFLLYVIDIVIKNMNDNDIQNLLKKIFLNNLKKYLNNKYGRKILYKIVKRMDLLRKEKIKYFLAECLESEIYNNEEKNIIINIILHIK